MKIVGAAVAALAVLVAAAVGFVASPWFADLAKAQAIEVVRDRYQRTLRIDGPLEFSFGPRLGFDVAGVSLSEHGSAEEFAAVAAMRIGVAVAPLFSRRVVVDAVELRGLRAALVRRKDGTLNIDDLLSAEKPAGAPLAIEIAAVRLDGARLTWRDETRGGDATQAAFDLACAGIEADTGTKAFRAGTLTLAAAKPLRAKLALAGVAGSPEKLEVQRLAIDFDLGVADAAVKGTLASPFAADFAGRTLALGDLSGSVAVAHPRLARPLNLPLAGTLHADLRRQSAAGRLAARLDESKLALKLAVTRFAPPRLAFELDIDRLDVDRYLRPSPQAARERAAKADVAPRAELDVSGTLRIGSLSVGAVKASKVALRIASVDGRLDTDILKALGAN